MVITSSSVGAVPQYLQHTLTPELVNQSVLIAEQFGFLTFNPYDPDDVPSRDGIPEDIVWVFKENKWTAEYMSLDRDWTED